MNRQGANTSQHRPSRDDPNRKELYVKNIGRHVSDDAFQNLFRKFGALTQCNLVKDKAGIPKGFAYVNYAKAEDAQRAKVALNDKVNLDSLLFLFWSKCEILNPNSLEKPQPESFDYKDDRYGYNDLIYWVGGNTDPPTRHLFVKNIHFDVSDTTLSNIFSRFGTVTSCKILKKPGGFPKGIAYVSMATLRQAEAAKENITGEQLMGRTLEVVWSRTSPPNNDEQDLGYDDGYGFIYSRDSGSGNGLSGGEVIEEYISDMGNSSPMTCHLFVKNISFDVSEATLINTFSDFGTVSSCRILKRASGHSKGIAYVSMATPQQAAIAKKKLTGEQLMGRTLDVVWSRSSPPNNHDEQDIASDDGNGGIHINDFGNGGSLNYGKVIEEDISDINGMLDPDGFLHEDIPWDVEATAPEYPKEQSTGYRKIFIYNLHHDAEKSFIQDLFKRYGTVTYCNIQKSSSPGVLSWGFLIFETHREALAALHALQGYMIKGLDIQLSWSQKKVISSHFQPSTQPELAKVSDLALESVVGKSAKELSQNTENTSQYIGSDSQNAAPSQAGPQAVPPSTNTLGYWSRQMKFCTQRLIDDDALSRSPYDYATEERVLEGLYELRDHIEALKKKANNGENVPAEEWSSLLCKSRRIAITVTALNIVNQTAVQAYELGMDLCLYGQNLELLILFLTRLFKDFYPGNNYHHPRQEETFSYLILYFGCYVESTFEINLLLTKLTSNRSALVQNALDMVFAMLNGNYVRFFRVFEELTPHQKQIASHAIESVRNRAFFTMFKAYRFLTVENVREMLHFHDDAEALKFVTDYKSDINIEGDIIKFR